MRERQREFVWRCHGDLVPTFYLRCTAPKDAAAMAYHGLARAIVRTDDDHGRLWKINPPWCFLSGGRGVKGGRLRGVTANSSPCVASCVGGVWRTVPLASLVVHHRVLLGAEARCIMLCCVRDTEFMDKACMLMRRFGVVPSLRCRRNPLCIHPIAFASRSRGLFPLSSSHRLVL
jgi:hypothetical protein